MIVKDWLNLASEILEREGIKTARLDSQLLACKALDVERAQLLAHDDNSLSTDQEGCLSLLLAERLTNKPIAQIDGSKEFYGHKFEVNENVLTPRPESEIIIDHVVAHAPYTAKLLDIGTGSGCLAVSAKIARRDLQVTACDISKEALRTAGNNAARLDGEVKFVESDLTQKIDDKFDVIVANLPYLTPDQVANEQTLAHEPEVALIGGGEDGLDVYRRLVKELSGKLDEHGMVIIEHMPSQAELLKSLSEKQGFSLSSISSFVSVLTKQRKLT